MQEDEVLGVDLRLGGEVEVAGENQVGVDDQDLVVRDRVSAWIPLSVGWSTGTNGLLSGPLGKYAPEIANRPQELIVPEAEGGAGIREVSHKIFFAGSLY